MATRWSSPIYKLQAKNRKHIVIDVTTSISAGLPPHQIIHDEIVPFLKTSQCRTLIDFGAGALRHTLPLLEAGFEVCAVEYKEAFERIENAGKSLQRARRHPNFTELIWPEGFIKSSRRFDCAILFFVLQTMPLLRERRDVIKHLSRKLGGKGLLMYASRYGQVTRQMEQRRVLDGYYMNPTHATHSFYAEFPTEITHDMFEKWGLEYRKNLSARGTEQVILYGKKQSPGWI